MKLTGERPLRGRTPDALLALHDAYWSYDEGDGVEGYVAARLLRE